MKKVRVDAIVDMSAFVLLLCSLVSGFITWIVLPSGGGGPRAGQAAAHELFLGWERGAWRDFHAYVCLAFAGLIVVHLLLHWTWIRCIPRFFARDRAESCDSAVTGDAVSEAPGCEGSVETSASERTPG